MTPRSGGPVDVRAEPTGIGVLGGSFNPPHQTHKRVANAALAHLPIAELRVVPAGDHPHKRNREMAPARHRLEMCRLAFADQPGVVVDSCELERSGPSFTVDTVAELAAKAPGRPIFFLIGSDNLPLLPTWHDHHRLLELCTVVTFPRAGHAIDEAVLANLDLSASERQHLLGNALAMPADAVSANELRRRWRRGERDLAEIPTTVRDYIEQHGLYETV
ncbi:MAG: nicotinate (nicotinamide) nucleotide adenylyltransferase [Planctomycetota bacterium]